MLWCVQGFGGKCLMLMPMTSPMCQYQWGDNLSAQHGSFFTGDLAALLQGLSSVDVQEFPDDSWLKSADTSHILGIHPCCRSDGSSQGRYQRSTCSQVDESRQEYSWQLTRDTAEGLTGCRFTCNQTTQGSQYFGSAWLTIPKLSRHGFVIRALYLSA